MDMDIWCTSTSLTFEISFSLQAQNFEGEFQGPPFMSIKAGNMMSEVGLPNLRYPFWTDIVGILSVPWDHSLVADNFVDIFEVHKIASDWSVESDSCNLSFEYLIHLEDVEG